MNKNGLEDIRELLRMTAAQSVDNAKQIIKMRIEFNREMKESRIEAKRWRAEHNKDMKEIKIALKNLINRIATQ